MKDKFLNIMISIGTILVFVLAAAYVYRVTTDAPYEFSQSVYQPSIYNLCPGDTLKANPTLRIKYVPTIATTYHTIWSLTENRTVVTAEALYKQSNGVVGIRTQIWSHPTILSRPYTLVIPELPAGRYELTSAVNSNLRKTSVYTIPFAIKPDCV